jgi:hypothetical protein
MREASFPPTPAFVVRFDRSGRAGTVRIYYGVTSRPGDSGFPALAGWANRREAGVGFPTVHGEVESDRPGYWSQLGWIQWVTQDFSGNRQSVQLVDRLPAFLDRDIPFAVMGYAPSFFDATAYQTLPQVDFRASLFLCTLPMMSRREKILPLAGFNWGYRISKEGKRPQPYPLSLATPRAWLRVRAALSARHRPWKFGARYVPALRVQT